MLGHECFGSNNTIHIESFDSGSYCLYICVQYLLNVILKHILLHCCHSCDDSVNICPEDGVVDRSCFNEAQDFIFETMRNRCACMYKNTENSICTEYTMITIGLHLTAVTICMSITNWPIDSNIGYL